MLVLAAAPPGVPAAVFTTIAPLLAVALKVPVPASSKLPVPPKSKEGSAVLSAFVVMVPLLITSVLVILGLVFCITIGAPTALMVPLFCTIGESKTTTPPFTVRVVPAATFTDPPMVKKVKGAPPFKVNV